MKKIYTMLAIILFTAAAASAAVVEPKNWGTSGVIPGTELSFSGLSITKQGLSVKITNNSADDVKCSMKITFYDQNGNPLGHSIFGLREIWAEEYIDYINHRITGNWKECRDSARMEFRSMTYEILY